MGTGVQGGVTGEFYDAVASLGSSVSSFVSTTAARLRASTQSFASAASQLPGDFSRQGACSKEQPVQLLSWTAYETSAPLTLNPELYMNRFLYC